MASAEAAEGARIEDQVPKALRSDIEAPKGGAEWGGIWGWVTKTYFDILFGREGVPPPALATGLYIPRNPVYCGISLRLCQPWG